MRGAGGTNGGLTKFSIGALLSAVGMWLLLDSVRATTGGYGLFTGMVGRAHRGGFMDTASMGVIFIPFVIGVIFLFYNYQNRFGQWLAGIGLSIIVIEIFSRIRFVLNVKVSLLLLMFVMIAGGVGLMIASFREQGVEG